MGQNPLWDRIHYWTESTMGQNPLWDRLYMTVMAVLSVEREGDGEKEKVVI